MKVPTQEQRGRSTQRPGETQVPRASSEDREMQTEPLPRGEKRIQTTRSRNRQTVVKENISTERPRSRTEQTQTAGAIPTRQWSSQTDARARSRQRSVSSVEIRDSRPLSETRESQTPSLLPPWQPTPGVPLPSAPPPPPPNFPVPSAPRPTVEYPPAEVEPLVPGPSGPLPGGFPIPIPERWSDSEEEPAEEDAGEEDEWDDAEVEIRPCSVQHAEFTKEFAEEIFQVGGSSGSSQLAGFSLSEVLYLEEPKPEPVLEYGY